MSVPDAWARAHTRELHLHACPAVDWEQWRSRFTWQPDLHPDADPDAHRDPGTAGVSVLRSFTTLEPGPGRFTGPPGFEFRPAWSTSTYRHVWSSQRYRTILTYVEGDLVLCVGDDDDAYAAMLTRHRRFYGDLARP